MTKDWHELTAMTKGLPITVERVRLVDKDIAIEGSFELPYLARLSFEDQVFTAAFIECHGSIKDMERTFGISYPTVKNRLDRIARQLEFAEVLPLQTIGEAAGEATVETLDKLERGEITADEAIGRLSK
ncbi:DUF2089 domain-containing protein [Chloroflexota bacterium]